MGLATAMGLVVASMIGTGVFTTSGLLLELLPSVWSVLLCWTVGGAAALCGALAYAELGAAMPHNGGEYYFLSQLYHPAVGFLSAWVSLIVGFAAPLAAVALAFGIYLHALVPGVPPAWAGAALIVVLSGLHAWQLSVGARVQDILTFAKVALIVAFVVVGLLCGDWARLVSEPPGDALAALPTAGFAIALIMVSFSYSGWNAAAYVAGEVNNPGRVLPVALSLGTGLVLLLYLGLNAVFLSAAPASALAGKVEVGHIAAERLLGTAGGAALSVLIALGLLSTVGALIVTGPRVYEAVGRDLPRLRWLARRSGRGGPALAIALQAVLALGMLFTAGFEALLTYVGFTLSVFAGLTVFGVFLLRRRRSLARPFGMPGYPVTPVLFLSLMAWMIAHTILSRPVVAAVGAVTILTGLLAYVASGGRRSPTASADRLPPSGDEAGAPGGRDG